MIPIELFNNISNLEPRKSVKLIIKTIDKWLCDGNIKYYNEFIELIKIEDWCYEILLAIATITYTAKEFTNYRKFINEVRNHMESKTSKSEVDELLYGLE